MSSSFCYPQKKEEDFSGLLWHKKDQIVFFVTHWSFSLSSPLTSGFVDLHCCLLEQCTKAVLFRAAGSPAAGEQKPFPTINSVVVRVWAYVSKRILGFDGNIEWGSESSRWTGTCVKSCLEEGCAFVYCVFSFACSCKSTRLEITVDATFQCFHEPLRRHGQGGNMSFHMIRSQRLKQRKHRLSITCPHPQQIY